MRFLLLSVLCLVGCTNVPGALRLVVIPERSECSPDEAILLRTMLRAKSSPVCLSRPYRYEVEIRQAADGGAPLRSWNGWALCGNAIMGAFIVSPVVLPASLLDIGDVARRFDVLTRKDERRSDLYVVRDRRAGEDRLRVVVSRLGEQPPLSETSWEPGEYVVRVRLANQHPGYFPPPLFWKPYDQPVEAETTIQIVERADPSGM